MTPLRCLGIMQYKVVLKMLKRQNPAFKSIGAGTGDHVVLWGFCFVLVLVLMHNYEGLVDLYLILFLNKIALH